MLSKTLDNELPRQKKPSIQMPLSKIRSFHESLETRFGHTTWRMKNEKSDSSTHIQPLKKVHMLLRNLYWKTYLEGWIPSNASMNTLSKGTFMWRIGLMYI